MTCVHSKHPKLECLQGSALEERSRSVTPPSLESSILSVATFSPPSSSTFSPSPTPSSSHQGPPPCTGLTEEQKQSISIALEEILPQLPKFEVKRGRMKKVGNKEALVSAAYFYSFKHFLFHTSCTKVVREQIWSSFMLQRKVF